MLTRRAGGRPGGRRKWAQKRDAAEKRRHKGGEMALVGGEAVGLTM